MEKQRYIRTSEGYILDRNTEEHMNIIKALENEEISVINKFGEIVKQEENIKDLIIEKDYVNGMEVYKGKVTSGTERLLLGNHIIHGMALEVVKIKTIVTKERFEEIEYIVESED